VLKKAFVRVRYGTERLYPTGGSIFCQWDGVKG